MKETNVNKPSQGKSRLSLNVEDREANKSDLWLKVIIYIACIFLAILSILPFWIMIVNATRSTIQINASQISLIPSWHIAANWKALAGKGFSPLIGFGNSALIAGCSTILAVYFSSLTAYANVAYDWKLKHAFFAFVMAIMMIPGQVTMIGFFQMVFQVKLANHRLMLILPAIASASMVFFMRQYLQSALSMEIVQSARIDGAGEFYTFNKIVLPIMKPAIATQAIFSFVGSWNNLFTPMVLLAGNAKKHTMPMMVSLLKGDTYKTEYGSVYLGLTLTVLPLFIVYFALSKHIIAGVALGSVKG